MDHVELPIAGAIEQPYEPSISSIVWTRSIGKRRGRSVWSSLQAIRNRNLTLQDDTLEIPQRKAITSLQIDRTEGRFLLTASADATVSILELSKWGRQESHNNQYGRHYKAIAQTNQVAHRSSSIVRAEWYAIDTGAFVSAARNGSLIVWDTEQVQPIAKWHPFKVPSPGTDNEIATHGISCLSLSKSTSGYTESLLAVGSNDEPVIKLVDIRSGASSHTLTGHVTNGITVLEWSPCCSNVLASACMDGTIRLWDVRKAGSQSAICALDRQNTTPLPLRTHQQDYQHLRLSSTTAKTPSPKLTRKTKKTSKRFTLQDAPNNYHKVETCGEVSHAHIGAVSGLTFVPDGQQLVSSGRDGQLQLWDLTSTGHLVLKRFQSHLDSQMPPISSSTVRVPMVVTPDGKYVWVANDRTVYAYSLEHGGRPRQVLQGHLGKVTALEYHQNATKLLSGGAESLVLVWGHTGRTNAATSQNDRSKRRRLAPY